MKWFALLGLLLFLGIAVAPSINADVNKPEIIEPEVVEDKFEKLIGLVEGIISYYERTYEPLSDEDCECEEQEPTPWSYPIICTLLLFPYVILLPINLFFNIVTGGAIPLFGNILTKIVEITEALNCYQNWIY